MAKLDWTLLAAVLALTATGITLPAQVGFEVNVNAALGFGIAPESFRIVPLSEHTAIVLSPCIHTSNRTPTASLQIIHQVDGARSLEVVALPLSGFPVDTLWPTPYRIDGDSAALPGTGADGVFGTADDVIHHFTGLSVEGGAVLTTHAITASGVARGFDLMPLGPGAVAWIDAGPDGHVNTLDDVVRALVGMNANPLLIDWAAPAGGIGRTFLRRGDGRHVVKLSGADGLFGSVDDAFGVIDYDESTGSLAVDVVSPGAPFFMPFLGGDWPQAYGDEGFMYPSWGANAHFGDLDDDLVFVTPDGQGGHRVAFVRVNDAKLWTTLVGPGKAVVLDDGTVVIGSPLGYLAPGSIDEHFVYLPGPLSSRPSVATVDLGTALTRNGHPQAVDVVRLDCGTLLAKSYGAAGLPSDPSDHGFVYVQDLGQGPIATHVATFASVLHIVPMVHDAALVFLADGLVLNVGNLDGPNVTIHPISNISYEPMSTPSRVSPAIAMSARPGANAGVFADDVLQFWKVPAAFTYGRGTDADSGVEVKIGGPDYPPSVDGQYYGITIADAPPSAPLYLGFSFKRDSIFVAPDAEVLLSLEEFAGIFFWYSNSAGQAVLPIQMPSEPALIGQVVIHCQWIAYDAGSVRRYQLSPGLTLSF